MKNRINQYIFSQTKFESSSITQLGFVVHQFDNEGIYLAEVLKHGKPAFSFQISVLKKQGQQQISVDMEKLNRASSSNEMELEKGSKCDCKASDKAYDLIEGGYGLFYVGAGAGGYSVRIGPIDRKSKDIFDSTALGDGDLFGITLMRPGKYSLTDNSKKIKVSIEVEAVKHDKKSNSKYVPPEPVHIEHKNLRKSKVIKLLSAQGLIYKAYDKDSICIELVKPADKEVKKKGSKVAHWEKVSSNTKENRKANK